MATSSKKKCVEIASKDDHDISGDSASYEEGYSDDLEHEEINQEIQVEFEALPPQEDDFHGIKRLLQQLFLKSSVNLSELTNLILSQNHVGSVLKQSAAQLAEESDSSDDEDNVYGVITVISVSDNKDKSCIMDICDLLKKKCLKCGSPSDRDQLMSTIGDSKHSIGLLLNERFINIPPQLAPPLHRSLQKDIEQASRKDAMFKFDYYLMMCKSYREASIGGSEKRKGTRDASKEEMTFANAEDECFQKVAMLTFNYPVSEESDTALAGTWSFDDVELKKFITVMIVPTDKIPDVLSQIDENFTT